MGEYRNGHVISDVRIDELATNGLTGVSNSLAYRIAEAERHIHSYERWFGLAAAPDAELHRADQVAKDIAPFVIDAGNDAYGNWVQILGSTDTALKFDLHKLFFTVVERAATVHFVQIAYGATAAGALTDGTYTEFVYRSGAAVSREAPFVIQSRRQTAGTKTWARCLAYDADTGALSFYFGLHYYEG